jgi:hypothetical protein
LDLSARGEPPSGQVIRHRLSRAGNRKLNHASCALSPTRGPAGARVTLSCRGFAPSEPVQVTFGAQVVAAAKATAGGQVAASFAVPGGFAGSHYPGRRDIFQVRGRQSGTVASVTFTVTG